MTIRTLGPDDIPDVARLFQNIFRDAGRPPPASLEAYLRGLFLDHPWYDPDIASRVFLSPEGRVSGFIGVLPLRLSLRGEPVRAAVAGSLMVEEPERNPLAGARLLRSYLTGPQDISISESANPLSQGMWERVGGELMPAYSMEWLRPLRPASLAVTLGADHVSAIKLLRPVGALIDRFATRMPAVRLDADARDDAHDADVDDAALIDAIPRFADDYALHPRWDAASLAWFLHNASVKDRHGQLFRRMVYGKGGAPIGCYLYYGRPRAVGWVLQIVARRDAIGAVIDSLFAHAYRHGNVAVRGRTQPRHLDALMRRHCVFFHRSSTVVNSKNPALLEAIRSGDAFIIGLAGEAWTRLIGGRFS